MKIERLLEKTSKEKDLKKLFGFSFFGFIAFIVSFFVSCTKNGINKNKTETLNSNSNFNLEKSTSPITISSNSIDTNLLPNKKDCGPTPGYPCGTKYYTISIKDFKNYN